MKLLNVIFFCLGLFLFSCNHKDEFLYHTLPVEKEYALLKFVFDRNEISKDELNVMPNLKLVINSEEEFPEEKLMGLEEIKDSDIDFQKYTLLLVYYKMAGVVKDYNYTYAKDFQDDIIIYSLNFNLDPDLGDPIKKEDLFTYCRCAILVSKISKDSEVEFRLSY